MAEYQNNAYSDIHRAFLQTLLSRQTITFESAKPLLARIITAHNPERPTSAEDISPEHFENLLHALNNAISQYDFEVRSLLHQTTRERIYALVNTTSDALTQMATLLSADEIAFVKRVLDAMFDTFNTRQAEIMAITSIQALQLAKSANPAANRSRSTQQDTQSASSGLTMAQAQHVLANTVAGGWFEQSPRGFYSLTPRALMELRGWLIDTYNDDDEDDDDEDGNEQPYVKVKTCQACREIVTVGQRCPDLNCSARIHVHCVRNMFRAQQNRESCPKCQTPWKDVPPVGELAARSARAGQRSNNVESDVSSNSDPDSN